MIDKADKETQKRLKDIEDKLKEVYTQSEKDITQAWNKYMLEQNAYVKDLQEAYATAKQYGTAEEAREIGRQLGQAKAERTLQNQYYKDMVAETTKKLATVNETALRYVNDQMPNIYSINYNDAAVDCDKLGFRFDLVDEGTVKRIVTDGDIKLPNKALNIPKDMRWNTKQLNSSVLQGIVNGESMDKIAKRILPIVNNNYQASIRNARTMVNGAENLGRLDSIKTMTNMGIVVQKVWMATHDERTRTSHQYLDGESVAPDEAFPNGLMCPGDPNGLPEEVYNCRCKLIREIKGFISPKTGEFKPVNIHNYEPDYFQKASETVEVVNGSDISMKWERRPDKFEFEIEDVINAQGFDGKPRVVDSEEFDRYVQEANGGNGFIAQRTYSAPDQETLDAYRAQLYNGKWYVDCSNGGAAYGKGMYSVYSNGTTVTEYMEREINGYRHRRGVEHNYIETFTFASGAKTITPNEIVELRNRYQEKLMDEFKKRGGWKSEEAMEWASSHDIHGLDDGSVAALFGYDAILTHGIDDYAIILNRTKVIFKGGK